MKIQLMNLDPNWLKDKRAMGVAAAGGPFQYHLCIALLIMQNFFNYRSIQLPIRFGGLTCRLVQITLACEEARR